MTENASAGAAGADTLSPQDLDRIQASAAATVLRVRERIEQAVELGAIPRWVLDTCNQWEQASVAYGAAMTRRGNSEPMLLNSPMLRRH